MSLTKKLKSILSCWPPYDGKRLVDIPASVLRKADAALKESREADRKFFKIMGIK